MRPDFLAGVPVRPTVWRSELMPLTVPQQPAGGLVQAGVRVYFPTRTDRGVWPVVGIEIATADGVSDQRQQWTYITLCDIAGRELLQEFPMGMLPRDPFKVPTNVAPRPLPFAHLPVCWENSYWQQAITLAVGAPSFFAIWVHYAAPEPFRVHPFLPSSRSGSITPPQ